MDDKIEELKLELQDLHEQVGSIRARADDEKRDLTEDEEKEIKSLMSRFDSIYDDIELREKQQEQQAKLSQSMGRQTQPSTPQSQFSDDDDDDNGSQSGAAAAQALASRKKLPAKARDPYEKGRWGFRNFGDFAHDVRMSSRKNAVPTQRLQHIMNAPTTYGSEGIGEDGGFLVPPDFRTEIMTKIAGPDSLINRCDVQYTTKNSMTFPIDNLAPWDSTQGIQAYWTSEGSQITQSKHKFKTHTLRLDKLAAIVPITEELNEDATALGGYLQSRVPAAFDWQIQNAIINGTGSGEFVGILNSPALISQAKDTTHSPSQAAATFTHQNVVDMYNRLYARLRGSAVWLINQDVEPQLDLMEFKPSKATGTAVPVYMPAGGASAVPYDRLKGREVVTAEACAALGTVGDVILADLRQYLILLKTGSSGLRQDVSMHLFFDYDVMAFRFIFRIAGQPWWPDTITLPNSSNTRSCFVALATRS